MSRLQSAWNRFEETRSETLSTIESLTQTQLDHSTGPGRWSVGEVADHLVQVDRLFRGEVEELLTRHESNPRGKVRLVRALSDTGFSLPLVPDALLPFFDLPAAMAGVFFPRPVRQRVFRSRAVPAKAPRRIEPRPGRAVSELVSDLRAFGEEFEPRLVGVDGSRLRYYNPLTGFTDLTGILSFVASHESRHQQQMRDVLEAASFPRAA